MRLEQGLVRLAGSMSDMTLIRNSSTVIDAFDLVKARSDEVLEKLEKSLAIQAKC